jgi:type II secretory pathway pseudopilin PulG
MHKPTVIAAIAIFGIVAAVVLALATSDKRMQALRDKFR